jgi:hypothetical protein
MTATIERAFELARGGSCRTIDDIRQQLTREKFEAVQSHLSGQSIAKQLRAEIEMRKAADLESACS